MPERVVIFSGNPDSCIVQADYNTWCKENSDKIEIIERKFSGINEFVHIAVFYREKAQVKAPGRKSTAVKW